MRTPQALVLTLLTTLASTSVGACSHKKTDGGERSVSDAASPPVVISEDASTGSAMTDGGLAGRPRTTSWSIAGSNLDAQIADRVRRNESDADKQAFLVDLYLERGDFLANVDDYEKAAAIGAQVVKSYPTNGIAHLTHAATLGAFHEFAAQAAELDEAAKLKAPPARVASARISLLMAQGRYDDAQKALGTVDEHSSPTALVIAASLAGRMQKADESERLFERARAAIVDVSPFMVAWMDFQRASLLDARGMEKQGRAYYLEALEAIPVYVHAAVHAASTDSPERAIERLEPLRTVTTDPELFAALADAHKRAKHDAEAKKAADAARARYEVLLAKHPAAYADHAARFYLGSGNDPKKALELAEKNAKLRPTEEAIDLWMGAAAAAQRKDRICASATAMKQLAYASEQRKRLAAAASQDCPDGGGAK
jgi:tetratricopeptide (TPR) repeat protein